MRHETNTGLISYNQFWGRAIPAVRSIVHFMAGRWSSLSRQSRHAGSPARFCLQLLMDVPGAIHQTKLAVCATSARAFCVPHTKEIEPRERGRGGARTGDRETVTDWLTDWLADWLSDVRTARFMLRCVGQSNWPWKLRHQRMKQQKQEKEERGWSGMGRLATLRFEHGMR